MDKMYYISYIDNWGAGINNKIKTQIEILKKNGYHVEYLVLNKKINKKSKLLLESRKDYD